MDGLIEGRIVHYVMPDGQTHRPAMLVQIWNREGPYAGMSNLQVFTDSANDGRHGEQYAQCPVWAGSVYYSETKEPNTWHWPERS
jgi:hypothetical protein